jgi:hypothetical protein
MGDFLLILLLAPWSHIWTHPYFENYLLKLLKNSSQCAGYLGADSVCDFLPGGLGLRRWTLRWIWQDPSRRRALHHSKFFLCHVRMLIVAACWCKLVAGGCELTSAWFITYRTARMTTGPIRSRCIHQAEPASSMLQRTQWRRKVVRKASKIKKNMLPVQLVACMVCFLCLRLGCDLQPLPLGWIRFSFNPCWKGQTSFCCVLCSQFSRSLLPFRMSVKHSYFVSFFLLFYISLVSDLCSVLLAPVLVIHLMISCLLFFPNVEP